MTTTSTQRAQQPPPREREHPPEPAWEVAKLFPPQGHWSEERYLALDTNHPVEFVDGRIEVLPMPTEAHQVIVLFLYRALFAFTNHEQLGAVRIAPLPTRLRRGKWHEPDVMFMFAEHRDRITDYWDRADLVMEVVSPDDPHRDLNNKR